MMVNLQTDLIIPVLEKLCWIFGAGLLLVFLFNIKKPSGVFTSEAWKRYVGWLVIAPVFLTGVFLGGVASLIIIGLIMFKALKEFALLEKLPNRYFLLLIGNGIVSLSIAAFAPDKMSMLPFIYIASVVVITILCNKPGFMIREVGIVLFGCIWICYALPHMILIKGVQHGEGILLLTGFGVALADIGAYSIGKLFNYLGIGTSQIIADKISPNKTWAGTIGSLLGAALAAMLFSQIAGGLPVVASIGISIIIAVSSVSGDLTESLVKRSCNTKDSGTLIPGHGGILDRIDSLLFSLVAVYYFRQFL